MTDHRLTSLAAILSVLTGMACQTSHVTCYNCTSTDEGVSDCFNSHDSTNLCVGMSCTNIVTSTPSKYFDGIIIVFVD